jgi:drug/metabolite transporter (DMT)-like permease
MGVSRPARLQVILAFAAVYIIWGSTYLAIRFAIETLPPFLMAGVRFIVAGGVLYLWARHRGAERPRPVHWRSAAIVGGFLLLGGNGLVVWAEQRVPSGLAALLVATTPLWMVLFDGLRRGERPSGWVLGGIAIGLVGVALLVGPGDVTGLVSGRGADPSGALALLGASLSWATGSIYSRSAPLPAVPALGTAMEMLCGGAFLLILGLVAGQGTQIDLGAISARSFLAFVYLIVFGSLVGFTAYIWLLGVAPPAIASTYAFVNPVVAVWLGWALASEPVTSRTLLAMALIVAAVIVITAYRARGAVNKRS